MLPPQRRNLIGKLISFPSLLVSLKHSLLFHHVMKLLNSGANWKCNGTTEQTEELITMLNSGSEYPASSEVVVAVPQVLLDAHLDPGDPLALEEGLGDGMFLGCG